MSENNDDAFNNNDKNLNGVLSKLFLDKSRIIPSSHDDDDDENSNNSHKIQ